jgi:ribosomal protein L33
MSRRRPEPVQQVKERRDAALRALVERVPYIGFLGIVFDRRGDELTALLPYDDSLIGNPLLPALHGGVTAAFLESAALVELGWALIWDEVEATGAPPTRRALGLRRPISRNVPPLRRRWRRPMAKKKKEARQSIIIECTEQREAGVAGISRYVTQKNKKNTPKRIELKKYNPYLRRVTLHREIK